MINTLVTWLEAHVWPWTELACLRRGRDVAQAEVARMARDFSDGYNRHFSEWLAKANQFFGSRLFDERERPVMRRFYEEGYNYQEALNLLKEAFGYGQYSHPFSSYRRKR